MDYNEKIKILDQAMIETDWGISKGKLIVTPKWAQKITPGAKHSSLNCVYRSQLSVLEVESKVDEVIANYQELGVPYRWLVTPLTEPSNMESVLTHRGLSLHYEAMGMMCSARDQIKPIPKNIVVQEIGLTNLQVYIETFVRAWEMPEHQVAEMREDTYMVMKEKKGFFKPYVAYQNGIPVGTSALMCLKIGGYLAAGTVDKKYRGQGIYRAMVSHRAQVAKNLHLKNLLIHAKKNSSAPICRNLGFEAIYDYRVLSKELK